MAADFDIAISGAGPVGLTLALLLVRRGIAASRIALIDAKADGEAGKDPRSIALSYGSRQILQEVGAWPLAADAIHEIHVSRRGHFGRTMIRCDEIDVPALGYVTRYGFLVNALAAAARQAQIVSMRPEQVSAFTENGDAVDLRLAGGGAASAHILVQAEGGLFAGQEAKSLRRDYGQTAIVAEVTASAPIPHRAFERFTDEGPLALLPLDAGYALIWCVRPETASRLHTLSDSAFLHELGQAFGTRVGRFTGITQRSVFPLGLNARPAASARTVAIGNAAQTLHPVAGQGLNLGLRDATVLAKRLSEDISSAALERFALDRKNDRGATIRLTDTMARVFSGAPAGAYSQSLLGLSLGFIDAFTPAKRLLAEQMMFGLR
jgi:2-octaprenyl-6-methoxyphenol hydroxylase